MAELDKKAASCKYAGYMDKYVTYPPKGLLPLPGKSTDLDEGCDLWGEIFNASLIVNPAFNMYRIFDTVSTDCVPMDWYSITRFTDPYLCSTPSYGTFLASRKLLHLMNSSNQLISFLRGSFAQIQSSPIYFDRTDVKNAIHAPIDVAWAECTDVNVFPHNDTSLPPAFTVLPNVIEKSNRSVIVHGLADFILIADGYVHFRLMFFGTIPDSRFVYLGQELSSRSEGGLILGLTSD